MNSKFNDFYHQNNGSQSFGSFLFRLSVRLSRKLLKAWKERGGSSACFSRRDAGATYQTDSIIAKETWEEADRSLGEEADAGFSKIQVILLYFNVLLSLQRDLQFSVAR